LDPEVGRLRSVARAHGVADRVTFLGRVLRQDMPALLRSADIVVTTPWYEPFGIVPLEAMACGRPVIASAVGGLVDTVVPDQTGVLVPPRRPDVLAREMERLLADTRLRGQLGRAAADRARSRYNWPRVATETARSYERVVLERRGFAVEDDDEAVAVAK
jgi:glycosyltransferase involved in cell wall biosynthesis